MATVETGERLASAVFRLVEDLFPQGPPFALRLWNGETLAPAGEGPAATVILKDPRALARLLRDPPDLALGEAYVAGELEIEGDLEALLAALEREAPRLSPARLARALKDAAALRRELARPGLAARLRGRVHSKARDRQAIRHHYDVGNEFFALWLDDWMIYSCGYFPEGDEDLNAAQEKKLRHTLKKLRLKPGEHLLDIGSGWGGLGLFAARHFGVRVTGVTLAEEQVKHANAWARELGLAERARFLPLDYRDVEGRFDKLVSVGMAEHVGRPMLGRYFAKAHALLVPGGLFLHHVITRGPVRSRFDEGLATGDFLRRYVFPDGEILPLWEHLKAAEEAGFEVRDVEDWREHYARTLRHWVRRLEARWDRAVRLVGEGRARVWKLYMGVAAYQFAAGHLSVHQVLLARPDRAGRVPLPPSRADLYAG